jgi:hypothetical protein
VIERDDYRPYDEPRLWCNIIVHEYGHSLGRDHSDDPRNIMHESARAWIKPCEPRRKCKRVRRRRSCAIYVAGIKQKRLPLTPIRLFKDGSFKSG